MNQLPVRKYAMGDSKMRRRLALGAVLVAAAFSTAAYAEVEPEDMVRGRQARKVEIQGIAKVEHHSNLARTSAALAVTQNLKRGDTIYSPSLNVDALIPIGRQALFLNGSASYLFHDANTRLDNSQINATAGIGNSIGPCGSVLSGNYTRSRSGLDDRVLLTTLDNLLSVKRASLGLTCTRPSGLGLIMSASQVWGDNSIPVATNSDYRTSTASVGGQFGRASVGSISVSGNYARTDYPNRDALLGESEGYEQIGGGVTLDRRIGGRIQATATLSYSNVELLKQLVLPAGAPMDLRSKFSGLTYSARVTYRASSRLQGGVNLDRSISPTIATGKTYELQTNYAVQADYRIGSRIYLQASARQSDSEVRGDSFLGVASPVNILTDSRTRSVAGSLRYRQNDRLSLVLSGGYEQRRTNSPDLDYSSERIGLAAEFRY